MSYDELGRVLSAAGGASSYAAMLVEAVEHADTTKLLADLEDAQYLEPDEIEDLFGIPVDGVAEVSPRDLVFTMRTLVHLHTLREHLRMDPRVGPDWNSISDALPVGSVQAGTILREIGGGYLVELSYQHQRVEQQVNVFLPRGSTDGRQLVIPSDARFRVETVNPDECQISVSLCADGPDDG